MKTTKKVVKKGVVKKVAEKVGVSKLQYSLEVTFNDTVFKTKARGFEEALTNFVESPVFPVNGVKTPVHLTFSYQDKEGSINWNPAVARRRLNMLRLKGWTVTSLAANLESVL